MQFFRQEPETDQRAGQDQPAGPSVFDGAQGRVDRGGEQQYQQRVGIVEAEDQPGNRRQRHDTAGKKAGGGSEPTPHRQEDDRHRRDTLEGLRRQHRPGVEAEEPRGDLHDPERARRLVDRDEVRGIEGSEEEGRPTLRPRQHRG